MNCTVERHVSTTNQGWNMFFLYEFTALTNSFLLVSSSRIITLPLSTTTTTDIGGAYGTARAGQGIMNMGIRSPELLMKNIIPVVMAGVLGIYGLIVAVIIQGSILSPQNGLSQYSLYTGFAHLAAGLCCGLSGLAAGMAIGIVGDAGVRAVGQQEKLFVGMILILIFAEALGLYGMCLETLCARLLYCSI